MMHLLARRTGLIDAIDDKVEVLKRHLPYHESDHVLNIAYNALSGGTWMRLERSGFPIRQRRETFAAGSVRKISSG